MDSCVILSSLSGQFSPVTVDVMDVSGGGLGILAPVDLPLAVGIPVTLRLPVKPRGYKLVRMEVRWLMAGDLCVTAGLAFL